MDLKMMKICQLMNHLTMSNFRMILDYSFYMTMLERKQKIMKVMRVMELRVFLMLKVKMMSLQIFMKLTSENSSMVLNESFSFQLMRMSIFERLDTYSEKSLLI